MKYFNTLPKVVYTDESRVSRIYTNLLARVSIKPQLLNNPLVFYSYDIQESDTPEIIAHKYYGDVYRYWIVLYANQILDPQWNWPLTGEQFDSYIKDKYPTTNVYNTIHHLEKIITQYDSATRTTTTNILVVDEDTYNFSIVEGTKTFTPSTGTVTITTSKRVVPIYTHEFELNESKRNIKLLNSQYVNQFETEFSNLMAA